MTCQGLFCDTKHESSLGWRGKLTHHSHPLHLSKSLFLTTRKKRILKNNNEWSLLKYKHYSWHVFCFPRYDKLPTFAISFILILVCCRVCHMCRVENLKTIQVLRWSESEHHQDKNEEHHALVSWLGVMWWAHFTVNFFNSRSCVDENIIISCSWARLCLPHDKLQSFSLCLCSVRYWIIQINCDVRNNPFE